jgi:hypothetical protein
MEGAGGYGALLLAAAAGLNPWLTLLITVGLAAYTPRAPLTPGFEPLAGTGSVAALAVLLGLDVAAGKVPRLMRWTERVSGPVAALAGGLLCLAVPNVVLDQAGPLALLVGALLAFVTRLVRRRAALALSRPLEGYRFGYTLASMVTNLAAAVLTALVFAVGP